MSWFLCWSQQRFGFFQEPLRIWIVEGTMPAPHEQMESSRELNNSVAWHMSGKFQRTYSNVAWHMSGKFQRTYNSVAWRMSGKFQRTYSNVAWRMSGKFQRTYIAWHDAEWKVPENLQRSMSFLRKITWTLLHAPPHPTPPVHTCTYRQPQTRMSFLRKFTWTLLHAPPHPKPAPPHPPMCTKHHGLLKAVVQLVLWHKLNFHPVSYNSQTIMWLGTS